jgi:hypothetical protein
VELSSRKIDMICHMNIGKMKQGEGWPGQKWALSEEVTYEQGSE